MNAHEALRAYLETEVGQNVYGSINSPIPDGNGPYVSLIATGGPRAMGTHNEGSQAYLRPSFAVVVRARMSDVAKDLAFELHSNLALENTAIGGLWFLYVVPESAPFEMPPDGQRRARWQFNLSTLHKNEVTRTEGWVQGGWIQ